MELLELELELDELLELVEIELLELELVEIELLELELELLELVEIDELELLELELLDELELELDWLDSLELETELDEALDSLELVEIEELLELLELELELLELELSSSIERMQSRSPDLGPGNWRLPVWKFNTSGTLISPVVFVSLNVACHIRLSGREIVAVSADPAWLLTTWAAGKFSVVREATEEIPGIARITKRRAVRPEAGPRPKVTFLDMIGS